MPNTLEDRDWLLLLRRIERGKCTPFLGAGACYGYLPLGGEIAQSFAADFDYPLEDVHNLPRVAQYLAVHYDAMFPKEEILKWFRDAETPDFSEPDEPHGVLADFPLPIYMTTNYDDFMVQALRDRHKDPKRDICRWYRSVQEYFSVFDDDTGYEPTPANPVVFHLHGAATTPQSLVLTEDDYINFLVNVSRDQHLLPPRIQEALAGTSLLFVGYSLQDINFRVLYQGLIRATDPNLRRINVTIQLPPEDVSDEERENIQAYLDQYFEEHNMVVYWGTAREFMAELRQRWEAYDDGN